MFSGFQEFNIAVSPNVTIHGVRAGSGPPLLLIHGFPQTYHIWNRIAPELTSSSTVICIDLRGYGQSSKPPSTALDFHKTYAKSTMATDCITVMSHLGFEKFSVVSHDRGARVAHKLCVDYPDKVERVMFLDIAPTLAMFEKTNQEFATVYWHWFFLIQPSPFPEKLIVENQELFKERFFGNSYSGGGKFIHPEAMEIYVKQLKDEEAVHSMCEDYRAAATIDLVEARKDLKEGKKIRCPVKVLWGNGGIIEKSFDCLGEWRAVSEGKVSGEAVKSGHYIAEEVPDVLLKNIKELFV
jgi:haloacetate dehalogenase